MCIIDVFDLRSHNGWYILLNLNFIDPRTKLFNKNTKNSKKNYFSEWTEIYVTVAVIQWNYIDSCISTGYFM